MKFDEINFRNSTTGIYCIKNLINNKVYIGQSANIEKRWYEHVKKGEHNPHLKSAYKKYGIENFDFSILKECDTELLDEFEIKFITEFESTNSDKGYNIMGGGQRNRKACHSREYSIHQSEAQIKRHKEHPEDIERARAKQLELLQDESYIAKQKEGCKIYNEKNREIIRKRTSEQTLQRKANNPELFHSQCSKARKIAWEKLSESERARRIQAFQEAGRTPEANAKRKATLSSPEQRKKNSDRMKKLRRERPELGRGRPVVCVETGEVHWVNDWIRMKYYTVSNCARGINDTCKGLHFEYVNLTDEEREKYRYKDKRLNRTKPIICIETGEIHYGAEWVRLGYSKVYLVAYGQRNHCGGKHFRYVEN